MAEVFLYAERNPDGSIYIGSTRNPARRRQSHRSAGRQLEAIWPALEDDEGRVHRALSKWAIQNGNQSSYRGDEVDEWIFRLLARNIAAPDGETARRAGRLPFEVWAPQALEAPSRLDGQKILFDDLAPRDRIEFASEVAYLSSVSDEWFTPPEIIEMVRRVFGGQIDTDPASHFIAQDIIQATHWYTRDLNGLDPQNLWRGRVWLNPPYGRGEESAAAFIRRLKQELEEETVTEAITCLNVNSTSSNWFQSVWAEAAVHCVWHGRPDFWLPPNLAEARRRDGRDSGPSKGIIFSYFGTRSESEFKAVFRRHGQLLRTDSVH